MAGLSGPAGPIPSPDALRESVWRSPLLFAALALSAGILLDRHLVVPFWLTLLTGAGCVVSFVLARLGGQGRLALLYLALAGVAFGAGYHHFRRELYASDDVGRLVGTEPVPVRVRGRIEEEPRRLPAPEEIDPLRSQQKGAAATAVLDVGSVVDAQGERAASGRVWLVVAGPLRPGKQELLADLHPGDEVEVRGRLAALPERANPGEFDLARHWLNRGVRTMLLVRQGDAAVRALSTGWTWSPSGWLAVLRGWGHRALDEHLPDRTTRAVARALLLDEGSPMTNDDWAKYRRTGVIHVLAISGQHLVVVGLVLWRVLRLLGVRQRRAALLVAGVLMGYALLTGGRPPAFRAGVAACALCGGLMLRRPMQEANLLALAWLAVALVDPTDLAGGGCQLSFLSVAVLCWGASRVLERQEEEDPLDRLIDECRPTWLRGLRWAGAALLKDYLVCLIVWAAITPLAAYHYGALAPAALLLGPPLTLLTSFALFAGFTLLALAPWCGPGADLAGWVVWLNLAGCERLVDLAEAWPVHLYIGEVPGWWVAGFYLLLLGVLTQPTLRCRWNWTVPGALAWLCLLLACTGNALAAGPALRCTFLAVGHGGCTVLEYPDGRVVLYDAGAIRGPDVGQRIIAPFLWSRKIHHIDDVILSHADLDHFNGLNDLFDRFAVGQVLCSPTFAEKETAAVRHTLERLARRRVPVRHLTAGQRLSAAGVTLRVLHPPAGWERGNENARSVVLEVRHAGRSLLLTGDLEGEGLAEVLALPGRRVDVLMAPHHGSHRIDAAALADWCRPGLVVSCQGPPRGAARAPGLYRRVAEEFWTTQEHGAIKVRLEGGTVTATTFVTGRRWRAGR
jgi:competence protein ComEC